MLNTIYTLMTLHSNVQVFRVRPQSQFHQQEFKFKRKVVLFTGIYSVEVTQQTGITFSGVHKQKARATMIILVLCDRELCFKKIS